MCGGDDHLAWKHPVSLEACRGLRTAGGRVYVTDLDSPLWIRVGGRLSKYQTSQIRDQIRGIWTHRWTADQQVPVQESTQFDTTVPPPPLPSQSVPQAIPFTLHSQIRLPRLLSHRYPASEDPHARMDKLEQKLRQMRTSEGAITWEDFDGAPVASLPTKFRMPEIERYTGIGCPRIHLRLYSTVMRAHGLDEAQMVMLFPMSLSGAAQLVRFIGELEALRQRPGVSHFIYLPLEEKISQIIDALYGIEEGIARGLWSESSPTDSKGKRPSGGQRSGDVGAISSAGMRPSRRYQTVGQTPGLTACFAAHVAERPPAPYTRPRAPQTTTYVQRPPRQFAQLGMPLSRAFQKLKRGPGHDTDHCTALRHAIQDLIDQGLVNLGQPSVTTNPLPAHSTHAVHPSSGDIHHMDLIEDDSIHMLSWDDGLPEPIVLHDSYEIDGVSLVPQTPAPFSLIPDEAPFQLTHPTPLWEDSSPPPAVRPFEGTASHEEVRREDDEVLRQLQSTQARISIWSLLASSSTHRDALIRALSQIRVETTTTPEGLIHMMTAGRATCIVFSDDDLPPDGLDHVRPLYITVGCSGRRVPSVLLDNGSALNVCPLATAIALGFAPSDFGPSTQTVLRIPTSFNLLLGRPWIHVAGAIPSSLHQKVKFIHDGQTLEIEDFHRDFVAMSFDQHSSTVVLDMMRGMTFLPGMGLGRRQQGPSEFIAAIDHDTTFGLGFIPTEADYRHMARLRKERVRARLSHTPFDYPIRPYRMSLADYFVRGSETRPRLEEIDSVVHTDRETELQHLFHQLQLSDGAPDTFFPLTITPTSPDRASMLSLCFPEEITSDGQITSIVQLQPVSAFDMFGVSTIEVFEGTQTLPVPELPEDDSSLFEGIVSPYSPVSCDSISTSAPHSPITQIFDIDDEIAHPSSDRDSFDHDSGPIDERVSPAAGDVETVDFGTEDQPRELKIGSPLSTDERDRLIHLLRSYLDVFAWSYEDMPGLDPSIVQHHLPTLPHARPVKQKLRRLHPRWSLQVKEEIQKQLSVGFISVVEYPEWLANVVPVPKKDGKVRVCHSMLSFMDGFSGYNQILMAPEDMEKTAFITEWGTYCYRVMPFGLKNAGATYQRAATTLFHDMMHRDVEVYVDDMIVKSRGRADHLDALERFFERIRKFRLRLNPKKCTFGVTSGKLLGHMNQPTVWNDDCQFAFEKIKEYLLSPPVLVPPTPGRPLLLYLSVSDMALGCMLAQIDDLGKERAIYYLSKRMLEYEMKYVMIERLCLALVWATRRLRHYMTEYSVHLISRLDPLRYLFDRPALTGRLMRWLVLLTEFDIQYVSQKSIKGSIVADHLASLPTSEDRPVDDDFPDEEFVAMTSLSGWCMYFDGAANQSGYGIGVLLVSPQGDHIPRWRCLVTPIWYSADSGDWKTRDVKLRPYHAYLELLVARFDDLRYVHLPRAQNRFADALATLASSVDIPIDVVIRPLLIESVLRSGTYPEVATAKDRRALRHLATRFVICGDTLYRRSADGMLLLCLDRASADRVMREIVVSLSRNAQSVRFMVISSCTTIRVTRLTSPWPFSVWGIDIIGKVSPKSSSGHEFILVAIDYFTKWVEAASYARGHFRAEVDTLLQEYGIRHHRSSAYRPQTNGAVEAANKNIKRILRKMVETSRDWSEKLPFALWAYAPLFALYRSYALLLVYGMEAVLPVETEMGSLRVALEQQISETEWAQARFDQLNLLDERRLRAADHVQAYQRKMARAFKKRVKPRPLQKGDLVLRILRGLIGDPRGKFRPSWSGPYVIRELTPEGAAWLTDLDGNQFSEPTNVDQLKKYYV
ncbi:Retrovirus-related Pol polyprotein from transposon 17.6 [Vitis vinifera]|uniref:Retrovirus-related Pol polyprotein from transposon 17.6 n=1 Tax=Vitis vinifera TaxID=29760 RepID=A0A438FMP7_VITVI|nr:Retrovirus-related Pol polyprotein from transposon 17.6 [Vitis vinifera]